MSLRSNSKTDIAFELRTIENLREEHKRKNGIVHMYGTIYVTVHDTVHIYGTIMWH